MNSHHTFDIGTAALLACQWEVTVPKPGNVHRGADFDDTTFSDFLTSAAAIAPILNAAADRSLGDLVLQCVQATRLLVGSNTNLGIILLLAPLAKVPQGVQLREGVKTVLSALTADDSRLIYDAIRLAQPGGLGTAKDLDIKHSPPADLLSAMRLAADRDDVALQYVTNFQFVFEKVVPQILAGRDAEQSLTSSIIRTQLTLLSERGDSLIARKCGGEMNNRVREHAAYCLESQAHGEEAFFAAVADFDFWLRADGRKRNPGTTADLIAAGLYVIFRDSLWPPPWR